MYHFKDGKDLQNAIGFKRHYGSTPAIDLIPYMNKEEAVVFIFPHDIRHILKTICNSKENACQSFTVLENDMSVLLRNVLLLELVIDKQFTLREKTEIFIDIFANQFISAKSLGFISERLKTIQDDLTDRRQGCSSVFNFKGLKYKQIDEMSNLIDLWRSLVKSNKIKREHSDETYRNSRVRYLFKDRYDYRQNIVDGDYVWGIKRHELPLQSIYKHSEIKEKQIVQKLHPFYPLTKFKEYFKFREYGITYSIHNSEENHQFFNVTMLDYVEGKKKDNKDLCEVLGFWGDISISPFWCFGLTVNTEEELLKKYKKVNGEYIMDSSTLIYENVEDIISNVDRVFSESNKPQINVFLSDTIDILIKKNKLTNLTYISYEGHESCKDKLKALSNDCLKETTLIIELPVFYSVIDIKQRKLLTDKVKELWQSAKLIEDRYHHLIFKL